MCRSDLIRRYPRSVEQSQPYTSAEFRTLLQSLQRYAEAGLDQFANWRIDTQDGDVFITVSRYPERGAEASAYDLVTPQMPLKDDRV